MNRTRNAVRAALRAEAEQLTSAHLQRDIKTPPSARSGRSWSARPGDVPAVIAPQRLSNRRGWLIAATVAVAVSALGVILSLQQFRSPETSSNAPGPAAVASATTTGADTTSGDSLIGRWSVSTILSRRTGQQTVIPPGSVTFEFRPDGQIVFRYEDSIANGKYTVDLKKQKLAIHEPTINLIGITPGNPVADAFVGARNSLFAEVSREEGVIASLHATVLTVDSGTFVITATYTDANISTGPFPSGVPSTPATSS